MKSRQLKKGFTLIELLIVIGLLGALTALVLPSLQGDREEAMAKVCDFNQAGTLRTLEQYQDMYGVCPSNLHTGFMTQAGSAFTDVVEGLPEAQEGNMKDKFKHAQLDASQALSLAKAGVTSLAFGEKSTTGTDAYKQDADGNYLDSTGTITTNPDEYVSLGASNGASMVGTSVIQVGTDWEDDSGNGTKYSFYGKTIEEYEAEGAIVVRLWLTSMTNWDKPATGKSANQDWTGGNFKLKLKVAGQCPIPAEALSGDDGVTFSYYMVYFQVFNDGSKAKFIGTSCPEDGIFNP